MARNFKDFLSDVVGKLPQLASEVLTVATSPNPIGASIQAIGHLLGKEPNNPEAQNLLNELEQSKMDWELEVMKLDIERQKIEQGDKANARQMYMANGQKQVDEIGSNIMNRNLVFIFALLIVQVVVTTFGVFFSQQVINDKNTAIALGTSLGSVIGGAIGVVVGSLMQERNQVVGFYFGSSFGSQKKDMKD